MVRFNVPRNGDGSQRTITANCPLHDLRRVKSSSGQTRASRRSSSTDIKIGDHRHRRPKITLTTAPTWASAMLLGRSPSAARFLVDPGRSFLMSRTANAAKRRDVT